jgi:hypothetical protein
MKQYLISIYQPDGPAPDPEFLEPIMAELQQIQRDLRKSGSWVFSAGLHAPDTATVVRAKDGDAMITDGPFVEGKEHWPLWTNWTCRRTTCCPRYGPICSAASAAQRKQLTSTGRRWR